MKYSFVFLFILSVISVFGQAPTVQRQLSWTAPREIPAEQNAGDAGYFCHFNEASYPDVATFIPFYSETFPVSATANETIAAELFDLKFIPLSRDEKQKVDFSQIEITGQLVVEQVMLFQRKLPYVQLSVMPFRRNPQNGQIEKLQSFSVRFRSTRTARHTPPPHEYAAQSALRSGNWVKIRIEEDGIYKMTYQELSGLGISNPQAVRLFGYGSGMLPVWNDEDNFDDMQEMKLQYAPDGIVFYAQGPLEWKFDDDNQLFVQVQHQYSDAAYYFLTSDYDSGFDNEIAQTAPVTTPASQQVNYFYSHQFHELEDTNFMLSGQRWYGEMFDIKTDYDFTFDFPNRRPGSEVKMKIALIARSRPESSFTISSSNFSSRDTVPDVSYSYDKPFAYEIERSFSFVPSAGQEVTINVELNKRTASAKGWLNYIALTAQRDLQFTGGQMEIKYFDENEQTGITEFSVSNASGVTLWDITDFHNASLIPATAGGGSLTFKKETSGDVSHFIAFDGSNFLSPITEGNDVGLVENQNLHALSAVDMVIVTPELFHAQAEALADLHRTHDGLSVEVVDIQSVYNEFSSGTPDAGAIRNFMRMFYDNASGSNNMLRYLLLFGDGSYDNKGLSAPEGQNTNFLPTYQTDYSLSPTSSYVIDDFYGLLDSNEGNYYGLLDIGIGRFPVKTVTEANNMVTKVQNYISAASFGDWRNQLTFIADDADEAQPYHTTDSDRLTVMIDTTHAVYNIEKIYFLAYPQESSSGGQSYPDVTNAINNRMRKGALIVNYTGHGNEEGWAHEKVLTISDINSWENPDRLPVFVTATCEFSRFDDFRRTSAGELVFLNANGGAIALFTTTRLVYSYQNMLLNRAFLKRAFQRDNTGEYYRLGDIIRLTKNDLGTGDSNKRNFSLLGDPALRMAYPEYNVETTAINGTPIEQPTDTLKAFSKITIEGYVADHNGNKMSDFNGTVYPTVYDKESTMVTLPNDGAEVMEFDIQNSILYRGKATVTHGDFSFTFIVPKDISYNFGAGKVSYYAENQQVDAHGYYDEIIVGGSDTTVTPDTQGPEITLYLNDEMFVSGSITDENPVILAYVNDSSGINTVGSGIGHDITAVIDEQLSEPYVLNDFYEADKDSYQSGKIEYALSDIEDGRHELQLKVWDVFNNSAQATTEFVVAESAEVALDHIFNYPNPFTQSTDFYFEHNQANMDLDVLIQIFTVSGKLVKTIDTQINTNGYNSGPIHWDGLDDYGSPIGRGVYIYRIKVQNGMGNAAEELEKLVILK